MSCELEETLCCIVVDCYCNR